jgi:endoglycosylceramidase
LAQMGRWGNTGSIAIASLLVASAIVGCSGDDGGGGDDRGDRGPGESPAAEAPPLPRLHAVRGERPGIFDEDGRQVVLRGVNLNFLAEYAVNNPDYAPTIDGVDAGTWDEIADEGMNTVRLLVSWSRLEPERGRIDEGYVEEIRQAVADAADRGLYVVIDMHQDAWGPFVATPEGVECPPGQEPSNGWDGAPEWATPTPGVNSCRGAEGEAKPGSELVFDAWDRFYRDADGVRTALVTTWAALVEGLGDAPNIAGYDLLNEPGHGRGPTAPPALLAEFPALGEFYDRAIDAIRLAEQDAGVDPRPVFFEQTVAGSAPPADFSDDPGLVFAPHIYGGSIIEFLTVDQNWDLVHAQATGFGTSLWIGEYGWFDDPAARPEYVERATRFGEREDGAPSDGPGATPPPFVPAGSAWWQWTTGCGDPHRIVDRGLEPEGPSWQYRLSECPSGADLGVVPEWRTLVTRPMVRFAPGWLTSVTSDGESDGDGDGPGLRVEAVDAEPGQQLVLWFPGGPGNAKPQVDGEGIADAASEQLGRGWLVTATVEAAGYRVEVAPAASGTG